MIRSRTSYLLAIAAVFCTAAAPAQDTKTQDHISVEQLKRAISMADHDDSADRESKAKVREYMIKRWLEDRAIEEAEHKDNLRQALDSWYANNRDWRKIVPEAWSKLSDADRGRLKLGIDPELTYTAPISTGPKN